MFSVSRASLSIGASDTDSVAVVFSPTRYGIFEDSLVITSNDPRRQRLVVRLIGKVIKYLTSSSDTIIFGVALMGDSLFATVKIYNNNNLDTLYIKSSSITPPFYFASQLVPFLKPLDSAVISLKFSPRLGGKFMGRLTIVSAIRDATVYDTLSITLVGFMYPLKVEKYKQIQSGVIKFIYNLRSADSVSLVSFVYSKDRGQTWVESSNISGNLSQLIGERVDTIYWDTGNDLPNFESKSILVKFVFSTVSANYEQILDSVGVDNIAPRFSGVKFGLGDTSRVLLRWGRGVDLSEVLSYRVYVRSDSGVYDFSSPRVEVRDTFAVVSGLVNYRRYYFIVRAVDEVGNEDTNRVEVSVVPGAKSSIVSLGVLKDKASGDVKVVYRLSSLSGDTVSLRFYYSVDGGVNWVESGNVSGRMRDIFEFPYQDTLSWASKLDALVETQNCVIKVVPFGFVGEGYSKMTNKFTLDNIAPRFSGVKGYKKFGNGLILYWDKAIDISRVDYIVYISTTNEFDINKPYATVSSDSILIVGLSALTNYNFWVRAVDEFGQGSISPMYSLRTSAICDYNGDNKIDSYDLAEFVRGWTEKIYILSDLYPYDGQIPNITVRGDSIFDINDLHVFIRMWYYSRTHSLGKVNFAGSIYKEKEEDLKELKFDIRNGIGEVVFKPDFEGWMVSYGFEIDYNKVKVDTFYVVRDGISLIHRDSQLIYFDYAKLGVIEEKGEELFRMRLKMFSEFDSIIIRFTGYSVNSIKEGRAEIRRIYVLKLRDIPSEYALYQNYPNPFNPVTIIKFDLPEDTRVKLTVYDVVGRVVKVLVDEDMKAGRYKIKFEANDLSSGVYFYQLVAGKYRNVRKMLLVK